MVWWQTLLSMVGLPALKWALALLEQKYPGLAPLINQIIGLLGKGHSAQKIQEHLNSLK